MLKGRLTLNDLARFSGYTLKRVKETLIVLIQHGIVYFSEPTDDDPVAIVRQKDTTYYEINVDKILIRLRMGRMMRITEEHYGKAVKYNMYERVTETKLNSFLFWNRAPLYVNSCSCMVELSWVKCNRGPKQMILDKKMVKTNALVK